MTNMHGRMPTRGIQNPIATKIQADSLPLPSGAATEVKQDTGNASLSSIDAKIDNLTTPLDTQPVSADALPLPSGAATSAKQDTQTTLLQGIAGMIPSAYDYISQTIGSTSKTFVFKTGGSGGTTVSTIVINYTDTTLNTMSSVVKT